MDITLQKSTELGVSRIVPIASERSVVKLSSDRADRRVAHWRNVVIAACEQCGRNHVPEVAAITAFAAFLSRAASFGPRVLRTETAPLAAIAAMQALWGDC